MRMQKIGILGGAAWPSTVEYYRLLCTWSNDHFRALGFDAPLPTPPMAIESLVMHETRKLRAKPGSGEAGWAAYDAVIAAALRRLQDAGCDFAIIANNTWHTRLHAVRQGLAIPILSILDVAAETARQSGKSQALVLGTSVTMRADSYAAALQRVGLTANDRCDDATIDGLQRLIDTEFEVEPVTHKGREMLLGLCARLVPDPANTAVVLACTELPLAFPEHSGSSVFESDGFTFVDTMAAHVRATLNRSLEIDP